MPLRVKDLVRLVETPKEQAADALAQLGGVEGVAHSLNVALDQGLDTHNAADLAAREATYGRNYIEPEKPQTILQLMWQAFQDLTIMILTGAGVISLILGLIPFPESTADKQSKLRILAGSDSGTAWIEGASIIFAVLIVVFVTAINDYQKEKQFRALNAVKEDEKIKVIRNGVPDEVSKFDLVVGDIVRVDLGDIIPADGLVFDENDLKLDESAMTGESILLRKDRKTAPFLLSGTKVMEGVGKMLVICVGENSQAGIISKLIMGKGQRPAAPESVEDNYAALETPKASDDAPSKKQKKEDNNDDDDEDEIKSPLQDKLDRLTVL
ncbi:hypothetical protein AeMF1_014609, partial [Aphanomyces euteiches]